MTSSGCVLSSGRPELATKIPANCERLAKRVAHPEIKGDARLVIARYIGALNTANGRLDATAACEKLERELFGAK
jgi:hypothetical protein